MVSNNSAKCKPRGPIEYVSAPLPGETRADVAARNICTPVKLQRRLWSLLHWHYQRDMREFGFTEDTWNAGQRRSAGPGTQVSYPEEILPGDSFGRWVVQSPASTDDRLTCRCDHGGNTCFYGTPGDAQCQCSYHAPVIRDVLISSLTTMGSLSCGCWRDECSRESARRRFGCVA